MTPPTDVQLQATPAAPSFTAVFQEHAPFVWRALRRLGVREADVPDVCQDVFVVIHRKLPGFEGRSTLRSWIYGICIRTAADHRRRAHVRHETPTAEPPEGQVPPAQTGAIERRQARAILDAALDRLDADKRAVFVLYEVEELTMSEVAEAIGCPLQTAYSRLHAARRIVKDALEQSGGAA